MLLPYYRYTNDSCRTFSEPNVRTNGIFGRTYPATTYRFMFTAWQTADNKYSQILWVTGSDGSPPSIVTNLPLHRRLESPTSHPRLLLSCNLAECYLPACFWILKGLISQMLRLKNYLRIFVFTIRVTCPAHRNHIHVTTLTILRKGADRFFFFFAVGAHYLHFEMTKAGQDT